MRPALIVILAVIFSSITFTQSGIAGYALEFTRNDYTRVEIPDSESLDIDGEAITVEAWVKPTDRAQAYDMIICNKENSYEMKIRNSAYQVALRVGGGWVWLGNNGDVEIDEWNHVAFTYDGEWIRLYVNGEMTSRHADEGEIEPSDDSFFFASRPLDHQRHNFQGEIDEVRLWDVTRSEDELNETMNVYLSGDEEGLIGYWRLDEGEGQEVFDMTDNENHGWLGEDDGRDDLDPEWVESEAPISGGELEVDPLEIELGPVSADESAETSIILINTSEEDEEAFRVEYEIKNIGDAPEWFEFVSDNLDGIISPGDTVEVEIRAIASVDSGLYDHTIRVDNNSMNNQRLDIPITFWVVEGFGALSGEVIDAATEDVIDGAEVTIRGEFEYIDITDAEGQFDFGDELAAFDYNLTVLAEGYRPYMDTIVVEIDDDIDLTIELLHGEFEPQRDLIEETHEPPPDTLLVELEIVNGGNAPVTWSVNKVFPADEVEFFTPIDTIFAEREVNDNRLEGVIFADNRFYVSGSNGDNVSYIYMFDREGEYLDRFAQPDSTRIGITDMAWDGNYIWMAKDDDIWGVTTEGVHEETIDGPVNSNKNVTWDPDRELLWVSGTTTDIYAIDMNGEVQMEVDRHGFYQYGLSYYPDDPDGYNLYVFHEFNDDQVVHKINPETDDTLKVLTLAEDTRPGGSYIAHDLISESWVFVCLSKFAFADGGDQVITYQLSGKTTWLNVNPEGFIEANSIYEMPILLDTRWLLNDTYTADLIFAHDGFIGHDTVLVSFEVVRESPPAAPEELMTIEESPRLISVSWQDTDNETQYVLERRIEPDMAFSAIVELEQDQVAYVDTVETIYFEYTYRVKARNDAGDSEYSNEAMITPVGSAPVAVELISPEDMAELVYFPQEDSTYFEEFVWTGSSDFDPEDTLSYEFWIGELDGDFEEIQDSVLFTTSDTSISIEMVETVINSFDMATFEDWHVRWWVNSMDNAHSTPSTERYDLTLFISESAGGITTQPVKFGLHAVYPNPFNSTLQIEYGLETNEGALMALYDVTGRNVKEIQIKKKTRGNHLRTLDAADLPGGIYLLRLTEFDRTEMKKVILIK